MKEYASNHIEDLFIEEGQTIACEAPSGPINEVNDNSVLMGILVMKFLNQQKMRMQQFFIPMMTIGWLRKLVTS